jgi:hypothetical protein
MAGPVIAARGATKRRDANMLSTLQAKIIAINASLLGTAILGLKQTSMQNGPPVPLLA